MEETVFIERAPIGLDRVLVVRLLDPYDLFNLRNLLLEDRSQ